MIHRSLRFPWSLARPLLASAGIVAVATAARAGGADETSAPRFPTAHPEVGPCHHAFTVFGRRRGFFAMLAAVAFAFVASPVFADPPRVLRVAADPNNLPFSNQRGEGFENKLVELIACDLHATVEYTWWAQRRGFFRNLLKSDRCDLVPGVPHDFEVALTTAPYYRSTYVFLSRRDRHLELHSLDDPALRRLRIGVQLIGDDMASTPPAHALACRGIIANVRGYTVYGDDAQPNPPARVVDAVLRREVEVAIVWGPLAGYFARQHRDELDLAPLPPSDAMSAMPFAFDISVGVRRGDPLLRQEIETILQRRRPEIDAILASYGVPRADVRPASAEDAPTRADPVLIRTGSALASVSP